MLVVAIVRTSAAVIACRTSQPAGGMQAINGSIIRNTVEALHIRTAQPPRSMAARPAAIQCLRDRRTPARISLSAETGNKQGSATAVLQAVRDKSKRLSVTAVHREAATSRVPATVAQVAETPVTAVQEQATEVRTAAAAVVETGSAIAVFPAGAAREAPMHLVAGRAGSAEAAQGPAVPGAHPAWEVGGAVVAVVGEGAAVGGGGSAR